MNIESIVILIAVLTSAVSVLTSFLALKTYKKKLVKLKFQRTTNNKFMEIDEELIDYIYRIKRNERKAPLSVIVTDSELSILNKYAKKAA